MQPDKKYPRRIQKYRMQVPPVLAGKVGDEFLVCSASHAIVIAAPDNIAERTGADASSFGPLCKGWNIDGKGRLTLSAEFAQRAGIPREGGVVFLDFGDHVQIWEESRWKEKEAELLARLDDAFSLDAK